jgi:hypothetical protein
MPPAARLRRAAGHAGPAYALNALGKTVRAKTARENAVCRSRGRAKSADLRDIHFSNCAYASSTESICRELMVPKARERWLCVMHL